MDAIPFKKPTTKALLTALPEKTRREFATDMLDAVLDLEKDKDAVGYVTMVLYRDGKKMLWWNSVPGSGVPLEGALRRSCREIIKYLREKEG